jgi:hypothetical protein
MSGPDVPWLPLGAEIVEDVSPAGWIASSVRRWERDGVRLHSIVPPVFEAYVRIVHPARDLAAGAADRRWSELSAIRGGGPLTRDASFGEVAAVDMADHATYQRYAPLDGLLPGTIARALVEVFGATTSTAARCWYGIWVGDGALYSRSLQRGDGSDAVDRYLDSVPKLRIPNREYLIVAGTLDAVIGFVTSDGSVTPNLWWPEDRSWFVSTEIDSYSTYVASARETVEAVAHHPALETVAVESATYVDVGPFKPRWR